ncbi:MAG: 5'-nucleotidase C-terminal domain-containing protein [Myxococcales bacterium]
MSSSAFRTALLAALLLPALGCVEFNEECSPLVSDPDEITGYIDGNIGVTRQAVRLKNNSLGQLVAESYFHAFSNLRPEDQPDLAVENSGGIRFESPCESRDFLRKGAVKRRHLREVVPFDNKVEVVKVSYRQLKGIFEHSVASFSPAGQANPSGAFLQVYGVEVWVDCSKQGEAIGADGSRTREGQRVTRMRLVRKDGSTVEIPINEPEALDKGFVRLAINSFLAGGGDDYVDLRGSEKVDSAGSFGFELVASHFKKTYTAAAPLPAEAPERVHLSPECK